MKIGFVLDDGLDKPDGVQQYILTLGKWFEDNGHEVRYLVGETKRHDIPGIISLSKNVRVKFNGNTMTIPLPTSRKLIRKMIVDEKFDVLHIQVPYSPFFGARVIESADENTRIIGTFHILPFGKISFIATSLLGLYLRNTLKKFDAIFSVSSPAAEFAKQTFRVDSRVLPNSVDTSSFKPSGKTAHNKGNKILFLGRLVPRKGAQQLLKSISILKKLGRLPENTEVNICGDGPLRTELETFTRKNGLSGTVKFHGFVTHDQKLRFMQEADIAIFPSLSGESFGIVLIEAMAAGSGVVLGGNNPGYISVLGEIENSIVDSHDPEKMASQLYEILTNKILRKKIHVLQQRHVLEYDTKKVASELMAVYQNGS